MAEVNFKDPEMGAPIIRVQASNVSTASLTKSVTMWGDSKVHVVVQWEDLVVRSKRDPSKILLDNLTGTIKPGFTALMGPSGAGKSTLMNALAFRLNNVTVEGERTINGHPYDLGTLKQCAGYVTQDDILSELLTVEETLTYTAKLRLPRDWSTQMIKERVEEVMSDLGISHARNTVIGGALLKGVSGGEKKRVSVGLELLTNPRLLFLDEPTSGLDSRTAMTICTLLEDLCNRRGASIVCTIHQPSSKIFNMFSDLILLKKGNLAYHGSPQGAVPFFESFGHPCPALTNPADHVMDVLEEVPLDDVIKARAALKETEPPHEKHEGLLIPPRPNTQGWLRQYALLVRRNTREALNGWRTFVIQLFVAITMSLILGGYMFGLGDDATAVTTHTRVLFFCCITQGVFGAVGLINSFPSERILSLRERAAGMYCTSAYFLARITVDAIRYLITPILFSAIFYWMIPLNENVTRFFIFMGFMALTQYAAMGIALVVSAVCKTTAVAVVVLPLILETFRLCSGFYTPPAIQTANWIWLDYLSYVTWAYAGVLQNDLRGLQVGCNQTALDAGTCQTKDAYYYVTDNGYDKFSIGENAAVLAGYAVICCTISYFFLRIHKT